MKNTELELRQEWSRLINNLFQGVVPARAEWSRPKDIAVVLNAISSPVNHMYYPDGGGLDIMAAQLNQHGELEWAIEAGGLDRYVKIANPLKLTFWNPGQSDRESNFVLEVGALARLGDATGSERYSEELTQLQDGTYASRHVWDEGGDDVARLVIRYVKPARFAIFGKGSLYNSLSGQGFDAYGAHHNNPAQFNSIVEQLANKQIQ